MPKRSELPPTDVRISGNGEPPTTLDRLADPDPRPEDDPPSVVGTTPGPRFETNGGSPGQEIDPIVLTPDPEGCSEPAGTGAQIEIGPGCRSASSHLVHSSQRCQSPHEHRSRLSLRSTGHVRAEMHPVDEVHVQGARWSEHRAIPIRRSPKGMGSRVIGGSVGFDFDDDTRASARLQHVAQ